MNEIERHVAGRARVMAWKRVKSCGEFWFKVGRMTLVAGRQCLLENVGVEQGVQGAQNASHSSCPGR